MKITVIDNYDSFTYNLVQLIGNFTKEITVVRNDKISIDEVSAGKPDKIIISPGPGRPEDAGISVEVIRTLGTDTPVLGVCLGHQGIGYAFGAGIVNAPFLMHGKKSEIIHDGKTIFRNIRQNFVAGRYHSLVIDKNTLSQDLEISAETSDGIIMGVRHKKYPIEGIQFHPESILTESGGEIINNWINQ